MSSTLFSGSMQATTNVVHIVGTIPTSGVYVFQQDFGQMTMSDEIEARVNNKVGAGTIACIYLASFANVQATGIKASPPFCVSQNATVSITKRAGSGTGWFFFETLAI